MAEGVSDDQLQSPVLTEVIAQIAARAKAQGMALQYLIAEKPSVGLAVLAVADVLRNEPQETLNTLSPREVLPNVSRTEDLSTILEGMGEEVRDWSKVLVKVRAWMVSEIAKARAAQESRRSN